MNESDTLYVSMKRLNAVFQKLIQMSDTIPTTQPPEERDREERAVRS